MKFVLGFIAGASIAAGTALIANPSDIKKIKRKCRCAKNAVMNML